MLRDSPSIAFVATTDAPRARGFYEGVLGLRLVADEPFALVFDLAGVMLRVAKVEQLEPQPFTVLGWQVHDVAATVRALSQKGVAFERFPAMPQDDLGVWNVPGGGRVAWFKDPDRNLLSLTESAR